MEPETLEVTEHGGEWTIWAVRRSGVRRVIAGEIRSRETARLIAALLRIGGHLNADALESGEWQVVRIVRGRGAPAPVDLGDDG